MGDAKGMLRLIGFGFRAMGVLALACVATAATAQPAADATVATTPTAAVAEAASASPVATPVPTTTTKPTFVEIVPSSTALRLFNGVDLEGWVPVMYEPELTVEELWSVRDGLLVCSGKGTGYLRTPDVYENYILSLEWRWPAKALNSGVLLHVQPPDTIWPEGFEAQLFRRRAGDFLLFGDATCKEQHEPRREKGGDSHIPFLSKPAEMKPGDWNRYDIICRGDTIELIVNGRVQNKITGCAPARGMIAIKAEASPIEIRNIILEKIDP